MNKVNQQHKNQIKYHLVTQYWFLSSEEFKNMRMIIIFKFWRLTYLRFKR